VKIRIKRNDITIKLDSGMFGELLGIIDLAETMPKRRKYISKFKEKLMKALEKGLAANE
jgi:hypothetical protein